MDTTRLESIVEAIDAEAKTPAPSHANLARLVGLFFRELIGTLFPLSTNGDTLTNGEATIIEETLNGHQEIEEGQEKDQDHGEV